MGEANAIGIFCWSTGLDNGGRRKDEGVQERGTGEVFEIFGAKAKGRKEWRERGEWANRCESSTVRFHIKIGVTFCGLRWACFFACLLNCGSVFYFSVVTSTEAWFSVTQSHVHACASYRHFL